MNATTTRTPTPTTDHRADLIELVQSRMKLLGLNVSTTAAAAGIQRPALSAWLHGRKALGFENISKLAATLGLSWSIQKPHRHQRRKLDDCGCC